jgi:hypothetical protein
MFERTNNIDLHSIPEFSCLSKEDIDKIEEYSLTYHNFEYTNYKKIIDDFYNKTDLVHLHDSDDDDSDYNDYDLYETCDVCNKHLPKHLLTKVDGVYNFIKRKFEHYTYKFCPICLYFAANNELFTGMCAYRCAAENERDGCIAYDESALPGSNYDITSKWVIKHRNIDDEVFEYYYLQERYIQFDK